MNNLAPKECHHHSATKPNIDGQLPLHLLCQNPDADIASCNELIATNLAAAFKRDVYGRTPLFYSLKRGCSDEVVQSVFEANPDAVLERDFCGITPVYLIYHGSKDPSILKSMLKYRPSLALKKIHSFAGPDLLRLVCSPWEALFNTNAADVRRNAELSNQWEKVVLTVTAAHTCLHNLKNEQTHELHVALELPCSPRILSWFVRMYPNQVKVPMTDGKLPLHAFVTSKIYINNKETDSLIQMFLEIYPESAGSWFRGKLPIHHAIESGCTWTNGLQRLLYAYPEARQMPNSESRLYPFMMAAYDSCDLNTLYNMIREGPEMLQQV